MYLKLVNLIKEQEGFKMNFAVDLPLFKGPMDLLLFLIKTNEIDINDIPISKITQSFLSYIKILTKFNIAVSSEFIAMASELVYIKSKMLIRKKSSLENEEFEPGEDPRLELVEKLLEYKKYREVINKLEDNEFEKESTIFIKDKNSLFELEEDENWKPISVFELIKNFERIIKKLPEENKLMLISQTKYTVEEKITLIRKRIKENDSVYLDDLFEEKEVKRIEFICVFLAVLELVKVKEIQVLQHSLFSDIKIKRKTKKD